MATETAIEKRPMVVASLLFIAFLQQKNGAAKAPAAAATEVLAQAEAAGAKEHVNVMVVIGATWCSPC